MARSQPSQSTSKDRVTLDRAFSKRGLFSRTEALKKIKSGAVTVNGKVMRDPATWISLRHDKIRCDGQRLQQRQQIYLMLYKPKGVVTSCGDPEGRTTVYDLLKDPGQWVFPVGRLDKDTTGLLLMTNDAQFSEALTNPLSKVPKTYLVKVNCLFSDSQLEQLRQGIPLKNGEKTLPARVKVLKTKEKSMHLEIIICEGKNRQVRRMIEALGGKVLKLVRTRIGKLGLGDLPIGKWRMLDKRDLALLRG